MITEIACIAVGIPLGVALRRNPCAVRCVDKLTSWSIFALLFLLGLSLGSDDALISRAGDLGFRAVVISLCALMGSVLATWVLQRLLPPDAFGNASAAQLTPDPSPERESLKGDKSSITCAGGKGATGRETRRDTNQHDTPGDARHEG